MELSCGAKGLVNNMWYQPIPAEAPFFPKACRDNECMTLVRSRLPQTGFVAPHLREVVML